MNIEEIKRKIGEKVKAKREERGWARQRLAKEITVKTGRYMHPAHIKDIEKGEANYTIDIYLTIITFLGSEVTKESKVLWT